jgi:hypothetical protein
MAETGAVRTLARTEVLRRVTEGLVNEPLPHPRQTRPRILIAVYKSSCCKESRMLVRSRDGGFITQNCLGCGEPHYVDLNEIPDLGCQNSGPCRKAFNPVLPFVGNDKVYWYRCSRCARTWRIPDILPWWYEVFGYRGSPLPATRSTVTSGTACWPCMEPRSRHSFLCPSQRPLRHSILQNFYSSRSESCWSLD